MRICLYQPFYFLFSKFLHFVSFCLSPWVWLNWETPLRVWRTCVAGPFCSRSRTREMPSTTITPFFSQDRNLAPLACRVLKDMSLFFSFIFFFNGYCLGSFAWWSCRVCCGFGGFLCRGGQANCQAQGIGLERQWPSYAEVLHLPLGAAISSRKSI